MCGRNIAEQKVEYNVWSKHSRTNSRVQSVVETKTNKKSSTMCGRNIVEHKVLVETKSNKKPSTMCCQNIVERKFECNVWSKHSRTKSQVQCVVET